MPLKINRKQKKQRQIVREFFNLYALSDIAYLFTSLRITHANRADRISLEFNNAVENMYSKVRAVLAKSVSGEFRHTADRFIYNGKKDFNAQKVCKNKDFYTMSKVFNRDECWDGDYGGTLWGKAAEILLENPTTTQQKMFWIDRVFDMQHNNGFILNKSCFRNLEDEAISGLTNEYPFNYSPLDIRAEGKILHWLDLVSFKIKKLIIPLKSQIAEIYGH
jgi:hypothetical protein